jgi:O-antigen/teichoic acid export membrane protein
MHPKHSANGRGGIAYRLMHGVSAGVIATMLGIAGNLLLLPLYLRHWSVTVYGEWMALYSVVNYLGALDFGLTTAATNAAAHSYAAQNWSEFKRIHGTAWTLSIGIAVLGGLISSAIVTCFSIHSWLGIKVMSPHDSHLVFAGLSLTFLIGIPSRQLGSTFIAMREFAKYQWIYNAGQMLTLLATGIALLLGIKPVGLSFVIAIAAFVMLGATYALIRHRDRNLLPRLRDASWGAAKSLARPSGQFLLQMFANTIALQGPVIIISRVFGGQGVALFTTTRTVSNVVRGILTVFRAPLRPEYAAAYAEPTKDKLRSLFRTVMAIDTAIAATLMAGIWTGGPWLIRVWSHGQIAPDSLLLHLLLAVSLLEGFLWMLASAGNAANRFHGVSIGFLAYAVVSLLSAIFLVRYWGISAIPISAVLSLLVFMLPVTIRNAHYEIDLPLHTIITKICIPFAVIATLSVLISAGVTSLRGVPEWMATCLSVLTACAVSITAATLTMLASADRKMLVNRIAR